ncbi:MULTISPECIES: type IX secretion system outer membrane channel protein PorV [Niastella]|uniref:Type IX secretion system outer membrane channel protein PorV n=1 Tax=Niastella soli TaxID=2821487 RepID=A0ABS3Z4V3_9BACT|nr:type IX secretion system outer membrane channel protein PorV [Niastella soli]MBO9205184.1 type IX secretion system outer membrane channel protein PorV [Niastella soli]
MKKFNMFRYISFFSFLLIVAMRANAQENGNNIGITTTAVPFLRISPDARAGGMGDASIAISPDANCGFYNLAKTPFAKNRSAIGATYTPWLREVADDMYLATLAGFHKLNEGEVVSASLRYFSAGNIALIDNNGNKLQTANPREFAFDAGYSRKLSDKFGLAAALRYIHSNLATGSVNGTSYKAGNAVAADLSVYYNGQNDNNRGWTAGMTLSNLGTKIGYTENTAQKDFLPASLGIGAAYREAWDETNSITFALDVNKLLVPEVPQNEEGMAAYREKTVVGSWFNSFGNEAWQLGFGAEYGFKELLYLRLGYNSKTYSYGNWQYVTAGAGVRFNMATVNFSYLIPTGNKTSRNPLANTVRFGLLFGLN